VERKLAAILAADVAGYSRLMGIDEEGTLARLKVLRSELIEPKIAEHRGRVVKTTGDGILTEFPSVVDAVRCAMEVQRAMAERNATLADEKRIEFRVGINLGDIITEGGDIHGDGVNIAARLEGIADPGGICISESSYQQVRDKLAIAFESLGEQRLKNIARPVRAYRVPGSGASPRVGPPLTLPEKPSIAVLPFHNMSGDPEQEYFADGMVEDIITALSRIKWLFVIARTSTFTYKGKAVEVKQIGRELGVRYVLEGSVRKARDKVRITGQLIDAANGAHLWADRFDGALDDVFGLQERVAISVAGVIEPALVTAEILRSAERPTSDPTAYDLYLRATSRLYSWQKEDIVAALELFAQAIERDPNYGPAIAAVATCHMQLHVNGWSADPDTDRARGIGMSRRALGVVDDDPSVLASAAYGLAYFGEDIDTAMTLVDRALALNPSYARGWVISGWLRLWAGQPDRAIGHFENSLRLSPLARTAAALVGIGMGHFFARRLEDARTMLLRSLPEHPDWAPTYRFLASCYAHMGLLDQARAAVQQLRRITPEVVPTAEHWRKPEFRQFFLDGLRLAAGEKS
jgi:adenylate cyclase